MLCPHPGAHNNTRHEHYGQHDTIRDGRERQDEHRAIVGLVIALVAFCLIVCLATALFLVSRSSQNGSDTKGGNDNPASTSSDVDPELTKPLQPKDEEPEEEEEPHFDTIVEEGGMF